MKLTDKLELMSAFGWLLPLVTITSRDNQGNAVTVPRIFMPNERAWDFWWLFEVILPALLGAQSLSQVNVISTDGYPQ